MYQESVPLVNSCINSAANRSGKEIIAEEPAFCPEQRLLSAGTQTRRATEMTTLSCSQPALTFPTAEGNTEMPSVSLGGFSLKPHFRRVVYGGRDLDC